MRQQRDAAGFTLLEMLVVVLLLALIGGLVLARGPSRSPVLDARVTASRLMQVLRGARAAAIAGGAPVRLDIDVALQSVHSGIGTALQIPPSIRLAYRSAAGLPVARNAAITFAGDGSSSGGILALSSQTVNSIITIDPFTGRVEVARGG